MRKTLAAALRGALRRLVLLLALCAAALPAVFLNAAWGYLPALFLAALVLLSRLSLEILRRRVEAEGALPDVRCERGGSVAVRLSLKNRSPLFCPRARAALTVSDLFGAPDAVRDIPFALAGRETVAFGFDLDMPHVGAYTVGLNEVELRDFFGVFRRRLPLNSRCAVLVTPRIRPMDELPVLTEALAEAAVETRTTVVGGTDYTGVREYELGDPMKQIHWKLSSHSREYLTKLQESSREQEFAVVLDFAGGDIRDRELLMELNDCLIETALSLVDALSGGDSDALCSLLYCSRARNAVRVSSFSRDQDAELLRDFSFLTPNPGGAYPDARQLLQRESAQANRSSNAIVVTSHVTPELLDELVRVKRSRRSPELYYILPAAWSSRQIADARAMLRPLDEAAVPYHLVSTSVNQKGGAS